MCAQYSFNHPIFLISSASDLSEQIIFDAWSILQPDPDSYGSLIQQYVIKAFDWMQKKSIEISKIGNICNILKYTTGVRLKEEFCVRLIYCLSYALDATHQNELASKVRDFLVSFDIHICIINALNIFMHKSWIRLFSIHFEIDSGMGWYLYSQWKGAQILLFQQVSGGSWTLWIGWHGSNRFDWKYCQFFDKNH